MNEVNGTPYWDGDPDAGAYAKILKPASREIRKKDPGPRSCSPGCSSRRAAPEAIDSWDYLRQLYNEENEGNSSTPSRSIPTRQTLEGIESGIQRG